MLFCYCNSMSNYIEDWWKLSISGEGIIFISYTTCIKVMQKQIMFCSWLICISSVILSFCLYELKYPKFVVPSYVVAFGYCLADAATSGYTIMSEDSAKTAKETRSKEMRAAIAGFDTLLWQGERKNTTWAMAFNRRNLMLTTTYNFCFISIRPCQCSHSWWCYQPHSSFIEAGCSKDSCWSPNDGIPVVSHSCWYQVSAYT